MSLKSPDIRQATYKPAGNSAVRRERHSLSLRGWSVRHARFLETLYEYFADILLRLNGLLVRIGYARIERPMIAVERTLKGVLFDCRMCGQCVLSDTGMSCPMNCPKNLRNGPCGGVRADGRCEVEPTMPCVWVEAWRGAQSMRASERILTVQPPVDQSLNGTSAWLRATAMRAEELAKSKEVTS